MIDKSNNLKSIDEMQVTFDYNRIDNMMFNTYNELNSKIHDHLSDSRHEILMSVNMKHIYFTINLHSNDRHIFVFIISEIIQLLFIRMQQKSTPAKFTLTEMIYKTLKFIFFSSCEFSLLHSENSSMSSSFFIYINDIFDEFKTFKNMFEFLHDHFFSRIE